MVEALDAMNQNAKQVLDIKVINANDTVEASGAMNQNVNQV
jgi:hypothetical protein